MCLIKSKIKSIKKSFQINSTLTLNLFKNKWKKYDCHSSSCIKQKKFFFAVCFMDGFIVGGFFIFVNFVCCCCVVSENAHKRSSPNKKEIKYLK